MNKFIPVVIIFTALGTAHVSPAHAITNEQMDLDTMEIENIERDRRMQRMDDELQRIRDQLYYMRDQRNTVPCGDCKFK